MWASNGIDSGKNYWEVMVSRGTVWSIGVSNSHLSLSRWSRPSPSRGQWTLMLWNIKGSAEKLRTLGTTIQCVQLNKIGIYLDIDDGRVSFYNPYDGSHLHTFTAKFTSRLFPVFKFWLSTLGNGSITIM